MSKLSHLLLVAIGLFLGIMAIPANAYTRARVALTSNILIFDERVIFTQGTGSLTVLDLKTGDVLLRKKSNRDFDYEGTLVQYPHGVLMISYDRLALLDKKTFDPIWQYGECFDAAADDEYVFSVNRNGAISCRSVRTGELCWQAEMKEGRNIVPAQGKVLVHTHLGCGDQPALQVFDSKNGRKLLRYEASREKSWQQVYFDGEYVYTVDQAAESTTADPKPCRLTMLNLAGEIVEEIDCQASDITPVSNDCSAGNFFWKDRYFDTKGHIRPAYTDELNVFAKLSKRENIHPVSLSGGVFTSCKEKNSAGESGHVLEMIMPQGSWKAYASHLGQEGWISRVCQSQEKLVLGSNEGHVECLDIKTGRPQWIYVFPTIYRTMSFSSPNGLPPYLTQQAAEYNRGVEKLGLSCGSVLLPDVFDAASAKWADLRKSANYSGRITIDPSVDDPFPGLQRIIASIAFHALLPIVVLFLILLMKRFRRKQPDQIPPSSKRRAIEFALLGILCLLLSFSPAIGLLEYGRVSHLWTLALKAVFALMILIAAYATIRLSFQKHWVKALVIAAFTFGWVYFMRFPWWYA